MHRHGHLRTQVFSKRVRDRKLVYTSPIAKMIWGQKCEGNCGLWVLNEIIKEKYPENLKRIMGAVWELPAR